MDQTAINREGRLHGEFNASDASSAGAVTWYGLGTTTTFSPGGDDRIALLSAVISADAAARVQVFADADNDDTVDGGEALIDVYLAAGGAVTLNWDQMNMPEGPTGAAVKVVADAAVGVSATFEAIRRQPVTKEGVVGNPPHDPGIAA